MRVRFMIKRDGYSPIRKLTATYLGEIDQPSAVWSKLLSVDNSQFHRLLVPAGHFLPLPSSDATMAVVACDI